MSQKISQAMAIPSPGATGNAYHPIAATPGGTFLGRTPGGTIFGVTPGGTRRVYDRNALLNVRESPLSKSPIRLPEIPGVTKPSPGKDLKRIEVHEEDPHDGSEGDLSDHQTAPHGETDSHDTVFAMDDHEDE